MLKFPLLLLALFLAVFPVLHCSPVRAAELNDVVATLEKGYETLKDVQASFRQKTKIAGIGKEQAGSGELMMKRLTAGTSMFRFNYANPKQQIVSNGKQVWYYIPENRQVMVLTVADMFKGGSSLALSYLAGLGSVSRDFRVSFAREPRDKQGNYRLDLVPKSPTPVVSRLQIAVPSAAVETYMRDGKLEDTFPVAASTIIDAGGNETRLDYSSVRVNQGLDAGKFNFRVPAGVEIIKP